jgi:hypothetical protein
MALQLGLLLLLDLQNTFRKIHWELVLKIKQLLTSSSMIYYIYYFKKNQSKIDTIG